MISRFLLIVIRSYQVTLSALLGPRCRFYPSCSHYAAEAIETHGVVDGVSLAVKRVCKCHPFHPGGFDPVPNLPGLVNTSNETLNPGTD